MKVLIIYYSMYGHIHRMAQAVAEGVNSVPGAEADTAAARHGNAASRHSWDSNIGRYGN